MWAIMLHTEVLLRRGWDASSSSVLVEGLDALSFISLAVLKAAPGSAKEKKRGK